MRHPIRRLHRYCLIASAMACMATSAMATNLYVDPAASGAVANRYKTISEAVAVLKPGDHLNIAAGLYRESIVLPTRNWSASTPTVIQGTGQVVIDAADIVTGWISVGNGTFYHDWPAETAQVIVNGVLLQQIGGTVFGGFPLAESNPYNGLLTSTGGIWPGRVNGDVSKLIDNSFYYDAAEKRLYVRTSHADLNKWTVEVSTRAHTLLALNVAGVQIKNLIFRYGNTSITGRDGVVTISGDNNVVDDVQIDRADSVGLEVDGDNNQIISSAAAWCGQVGMKARGSNVRILNSTTNYNNTRGFNKWWEAGGIKLTGNNGLINSVITGHTAIGNFGDGIWFDWGNQNDLIQNSISEYNTGFGIQYEASSGAQIVGNRIIANGQRGIYLPQSSGSVVRNNLVHAHAMEVIAVIAEARTDPSGQLDLQPVGNTVTGNVVAWNGYALTVPGPGFNIAVDGNLYIGKGIQLREWYSWSLPFDNFALWKQHTGLDLQSLQVQLAMDPSFASSVQSKQENPDLSWVKRLPAMPILPVAAAK